MPKFLRLLFVAACVSLCGCSSDSATPGPSEEQFCSTIGSYVRQYLEADQPNSNEAALSQIRYMRKHALQSLMSGSREYGWVGEVTRISTDSQGKGELTVELQCSDKIPAKGSLFTPGIMLYSDPEIDQGTPQYLTLGGLKEGQLIVFSGYFDLRESYQDYISEKSITELGSMTRPEFSFAFMSLESQSK